jgi:glycerol-3-phosphate acyltransferase PlsY
MLSFSCGSNLPVILLFVSYLIGSIPFGLILTKISGKGDIRNFGSGNIGATNVLRRSGKFIAFLTVVSDGGKGAFAILASKWFCDDYLLMMLVGIAAILGHIFSIFLKFKGGKGVATSIAVFLILSPEVGGVVCLVWLIVLAVIRVSAVSALVSFSLAPVFCYFMTYDTRLVIAFSFISTIVILSHHENIKILILGRR